MEVDFTYRYLDQRPRKLENQFLFSPLWPERSALYSMHVEMR